MTPEEYLNEPQKSVTIYPNEVLTTPAKTIENLLPWIQISDIMSEIMIKNQGIGLAAPQIGLSYRAFIIRFPDKHLLYINPEIISTGNENIEMEEGCLSLPGVYLKVNRPKKIKVKWTKPNGKEQIATYEGLTSRVFQHEYDHLSGVLISMPGVNNT